MTPTARRTKRAAASTKEAHADLARRSTYANRPLNRIRVTVHSVPLPPDLLPPRQCQAVQLAQPRHHGVLGGGHAGSGSRWTDEGRCHVFDAIRDDHVVSGSAGSRLLFDGHADVGQSSHQLAELGVVTLIDPPLFEADGPSELTADAREPCALPLQVQAFAARRRDGEPVAGNPGLLPYLEPSLWQRADPGLTRTSTRTLCRRSSDGGSTQPYSRDASGTAGNCPPAPVTMFARSEARISAFIGSPRCRRRGRAP